MKIKFLAIAVLALIPASINAQQWSINSDQWTATDALGRKLSDASEMGPVKEDKTIGMFYWTWHTDGNANWVMPDGSIANITEILEKYPEAATDRDHAAWQNTPEGGVYWWDEPLFGYYRTTDPWVLRKHAEMLADAGVDVVFFDCTNGSFTWKTSYTVLLEVWQQARLDGVKAPQVIFLLPFSPSEGALDQLYELYTDLYKPGLYQDQWFMWDGKPLIMAYPEALKTREGQTAGLRFTTTQEFYGISATCPSWNDNIGNLTFKLYRWNVSYSESVNGTPLAEKTFVNYNDNAKLRLTFDALEAGEYVWELSNGTDQVGVWKWTDSNAPVTSYYNGSQVSGQYETEIAYDAELNFTPLTFGTQHEPVSIGGATIRQQEVDEIKEFFTFRPGQPDYVNGPSRDDHWGWLEVNPQHGYGPKADGGFEQAVVGIGQNASDATGGHAGGFNTPLSYGRAYTQAHGQDTRPEAYLEGLNFQEQWKRAFEIDPDAIFITGWNEWIGGRWFSWDIQPFAFVDIFSADKSRDIEPAKSWGNKGDVYYMQLVDYVRQFKGMQAPDSVSPVKTIDMDNESDWSDVRPVFQSYRGNTMHRDHPGQGPELVLTNSSGRNDIVSARVARDDDFLYFHVETDSLLSPASDPSWMRLFIDMDRDKSTGWEGYDYVLNRSNPGDSVQVEKSVSGWEWVPAGKAAYTVNEKSLVLKVRKSIMGLNAEDRLDFEFKWSDNMQEDGNIMDFYVNGDVAPGARFNYVYKVSWTVDGYHYGQDPQGINQGIRCREYAGVFESLPASYPMNASATHYLSGFEIPETGSTDFALLFEGFLEVSAKDEYSFSLYGDFAARLTIDGQPLVESSGEQEEQLGSIRLMPGKHHLKLEYISKDGNEAELLLQMKSSAGSLEEIAASSLFKYNVAPELSLEFKEEQNYFSEIDTVALVSATDPDGSIASVRIYDGEELIREETSGDFALAGLSVGAHALSARITDNDGAEAESVSLEFEVREAFPVPGSIQVEEYRKGDRVIVEESDDFDGGKQIKVIYGHVDYPIEVSEAGRYRFDFRVPAQSASREVSVTINGEEVATVEVGNTGGDESWYNVTADIQLQEGIQILGLGFGNRTIIHRLDISSTTQVSTQEEKRFLRVYPNPGSGTFHVQSGEAVSRFMVYDLRGARVGEYPAVQNQNRFSLDPDLKSGMYILEVCYSDGYSRSVKIIKQ